jgi:hypothetical protein
MTVGHELGMWQMLSINSRMMWNNSFVIPLSKSYYSLLSEQYVTMIMMLAEGKQIQSVV